TDSGTTPALTNVTWTCTVDSTSTCSPASGTTALSSVISLPVGSVMTFTVVGTLPADTPTGMLGNSAVVVPPDGVPDINIGNNVAAASAPIVRRADLEVTKTGPATGSRGANVEYTIVVTNRGPSDTENVIVTDPAPTGLSLVNLTGPCTAAP